MQVVHRVVKWVMLIAGLLTCTMFYAAVAPEASLRSNFGESLEGPVAQIVVRNWGILIGMVGLLLIYGAIHEPVRRVALVFASVSKAAYIALVMLHGPQFLQKPVGVAIGLDALLVVIFGVYLIATRGGSVRQTTPARSTSV